MKRCEAPVSSARALGASRIKASSGPSGFLEAGRKGGEGAGVGWGVEGVAGVEGDGGRRGQKAGEEVKGKERERGACSMERA